MTTQRRSKKKAKSSMPIALQYTANGMRTGIVMAATGLYTLVDYVLIKGVKGYGRNYILTALAQIGGPVRAIAEWARYEHFATQNKFSPEAEKALLEEFSNSYIIADGTPATDAATKFETFFEARIHNSDGFAKIKLTDDAHKPESDAIKASIDTALKPNAVTKNVHDDFHALNVYIQDPKSKYNPKVLATYLQEIYDRSTKALNDQLVDDKKAIQALFNDPDFRRNLTTALTTTTNPTPNLESVQKEMIDAVDASHQAALEPFNKDMADILPKMQKAAQKATDELFLLALLYKEGSRAQRAKIDALRANDPDEALSIGQDDESAGRELTGVSLKKLGTLETLTSQKLTYDPGTNSYRLDIPSGWHWYHQSADNQIMPDMMLLALAIKSQGFKTIVMSINHDPGDEPDATEKSPNPTFSLRMAMARDAYKACRLMGWDDANIKIEVNGKLMPTNELFNGIGTQLENINKQAAEWAEARNKHTAANTQSSMGHFKKHVQKTRVALDAEEAAKAAAEAAAKKTSGATTPGMGSAP